MNKQKKSKYVEIEENVKYHEYSKERYNQKNMVDDRDLLYLLYFQIIAQRGSVNQTINV